MSEFNCCHGTPKSGHCPTCPYDKSFWGPGGVDWLRMPNGTGINFHELGLKQHGPGSAFAKSLAARGAAGATSAPVEAPAPAKPAAEKRQPKVESGTLEF